MLAESGQPHRPDHRLDDPPQRPDYDLRRRRKINYDDAHDTETRHSLVRPSASVLSFAVLAPETNQQAHVQPSLRGVYALNP